MRKGQNICQDKCQEVSSKEYPDSRYVKADLDKGIYISSAYADKYGIHPGDTITLKEKYEKEQYSFKVTGIYDYTAGLCVFMTRTQLNETFDLGEDYYSGYFSDTRITDIKDKYIGSVVDLDALTKISRQLDVSMGSDGNGKWICYCDLYGTDLSSFQDHYRKKCPVYLNGKNPGLYKWRDQQAVHSVYFNGSSALSACQSSNRNGGYEGSVQGDDAVKHFRLDYALDRPDDLCADVCSRNHYYHFENFGFTCNTSLPLVKISGSKWPTEKAGRAAGRDSQIFDRQLAKINGPKWPVEGSQGGTPCPVI